MHPIEVLERYWNYTSFRPLQEEIIHSILNGHDTLALLPTGGGKSICFQIPALIKDGICIVISPLVSLMQDQVNSLKEKGIKAIALTSGISYSELDTQLDNCIYGNYKFLYLSPERLQQSIVQERVQQMNVNLIAVDEAHCISQWGHDFRPAYANIKTLRELQPSVNCIALTATAKSIVEKEILSSLDFMDIKRFSASFERKNISYQVVNTEDKNYYLIDTLKQNPGSSIIYVRSRKATIEVNNYLNSKGFVSTNYHGGLSNKEKTKKLNEWLNNQKPIMVATTAFGMGIDKPDVRSVIHYNLPESLESYYQEAGRAGRDGKEAVAVILKKKVDEDKLKRQFLSQLPNADAIKYVYKKLCNYFQISYGEGQHTMHELNFKAFCDTYNLKAGLTFNALKVLGNNSVIALDQRFNYQTTIKFRVNNSEIFKYLEKNKHHDKTIKALLRTYGGIMDYPTKVNLDIITTKADIRLDQLISTLKDLESQSIVDLKIANTDSVITFIKPREDEKTINPIIPTINQQQELKKNQIQAVIDYTKNEDVCKSIQLVSYFDQEITEVCGKCSVCLKSEKTYNSSRDVQTGILNALKISDLSSRALLEKLKYSKKELLSNIATLIERGEIQITEQNTYKINE